MAAQGHGLSCPPNPALPPDACSGDDVNDYQNFQPPSAPLAEAPGAPQELADRGARLAAKCVDGTTLLGLLMVIGIAWALLLPTLAGLRRPGSGIPALNLALSAGLLLMAVAAPGALVIWNCVWLHRYGQTIGKRVLGIRIVRSSGERVSLGRIFALRYLPMLFLGMVPYLGVLITLVDALLIFRDSRQCLHDQFADTLVVRAG